MKIKRRKLQNNITIKVYSTNNTKLITILSIPIKQGKLKVRWKGSHIIIKIMSNMKSDVKMLQK